MPWAFAHDCPRRNVTACISTSYELPRFCVVKGTYTQRVLGGSGSAQDTIRTGLVFPAMPRSASQTSPGRVFINDVQHFLLDVARTKDIKAVVVG